jgi:hypothetical protein
MTTYSTEHSGAVMSPARSGGREPSGRVDMHFIVRLMVNPDSGKSEVIGYLTYKEGINTSLFDGPPSEKTAHFTLRIPDLSAVHINNTGNVNIQVRPPGSLLKIYLNERPNQDWDYPDSFSAGRLVATYYEGVAQLINMGPVAESTATFDLTFNEDFNFHGKTYNFGSGGLSAVTAVSYFNSTPIETHTGRFPIAVSGAGVAYGVAHDGSLPGGGGGGGQAHEDQGLEGSFIDTVTQPDRKFQLLFTFARGGGVMGDTMTVDGEVTAAHGAWRRVGDREFALTFVFLGHADRSTYIRLKVRSRVRLNEAFDQYRGVGQMDYFDEQGHLIRSVRSPVEGRRIQVEMLPED